jgi:hypothetical protein
VFAGLRIALCTNTRIECQFEIWFTKDNCKARRWFRVSDTFRVLSNNQFSSAINFYSMALRSLKNQTLQTRSNFLDWIHVNEYLMGNHHRGMKLTAWEQIDFCRKIERTLRAREKNTVELKMNLDQIEGERERSYATLAVCCELILTDEKWM